MSKRVSEAASLELAFLAALDTIHADVDTSEIGEIQDWSRAVRGKFHGVAVKDASDLSKRNPNATNEPVFSPRGVSGIVLDASGNVASRESVQYSQMAIPQLIAACISEPSAEAFYEFVRRSQPLINGVVAMTLRRSGKSSHELVDDLSQDVYLELCSNNFRALRTFKFDRENAFLGFLKVVASNTVHDYFRSAASSTRSAGQALEADRVLPEHAFSSVASSDPERKVLLNEIDSILETLSHGPNFERDRAIFRLYYGHGISAKTIAALPGIKLTVKGIESVLFRLTQQIKSALTRKDKKNIR